MTTVKSRFGPNFQRGGFRRQNRGGARDVKGLSAAQGFGDRRRLQPYVFMCVRVCVGISRVVVAWLCELWVVTAPHLLLSPVLYLHRSSSRVTPTHIHHRGVRGGRGGRFDRFGRGGRGRGRMENRKASVNVESEWGVVEEVDLPQLSKLQVRVWVCMCIMCLWMGRCMSLVIGR